jgi:Tfp pilus assembly protein PilF
VQAAAPALLARVRRLAAAAQDEAAKRLCLEALTHDPTDAEVLCELAALALRSGHRSAARTAYEQAVRCRPGHAETLVRLGNLVFQSEEFATARQHFAAAVAAAPRFAQAHQGLAMTLAALGEDAAAAPHWQLGFVGNAVAVQPHRGCGPVIPVLLLVSVRGGNIPTRRLLDDTVWSVTSVFTEFHDPAAALPPHALVFNAVADADLCGPALAAAQAIAARSDAPVVNPPAAVARTGRAEHAARLGVLAGVRAPTIRTIGRAALQDAAGPAWPLLLRAPGYHTGRHFLRVDSAAELADALARLPGDPLLAIEPLDARGADGMARKYRVMAIDGVLFPVHLAVSADWKVHYFAAAMADSAAFRAEEQRFLQDMPGVLGPRAMAALHAIAATLGLDYAGIDFALAPDGTVLLFEANAGMVLQPPDPDPIWDYRRPAIDRAIGAAQAMLLRRACRR